MIRLFTTAQAAEYLGMSVRKFQDVRPALPVPMPGRMRRYDRLDLDTWVEGQKRTNKETQFEQMADDLVRGVLT